MPMFKCLLVLRHQSVFSVVIWSARDMIPDMQFLAIVALDVGKLFFMLADHLEVLCDHFGNHFGVADHKRYRAPFGYLVPSFQSILCHFVVEILHARLPLPFQICQPKRPCKRSWLGCHLEAHQFKESCCWTTRWGQHFEPLTQNCHFYQQAALRAPADQWLIWAQRTEGRVR